MAAGETYTAGYDEITQGFEPMERCVDDTILHDSNKEKFCLGQQNLEYVGYHLGKDSVEPSQDMLRSITKFLKPKAIMGVLSWSIMEPMRPLLKPAKDGEK